VALQATRVQLQYASCCTTQLCVLSVHTLLPGRTTSKNATRTFMRSHRKSHFQWSVVSPSLTWFDFCTPILPAVILNMNATTTLTLMTFQSLTSIIIIDFSKTCMISYNPKGLCLKVICNDCLPNWLKVDSSCILQYKPVCVTNFDKLCRKML